jgi:hypothetical protein
MKKTSLLASLASLAVGTCAFANVATFEGLTFTGASDHENGANLSGTSTITNDPYGPGTGSTVEKISSISSGNATLANSYTTAWSDPDGAGDLFYDSWSGWAYSKASDAVTPGFGNQYSSITGSGAGGSTTYAVGYQPYIGEWVVMFDAAEDFSGRGLYATNTTYAALDMHTGSTFSKVFGGASGNDADWFKLTIQGWNGATATGSVEFYLADFRFSNNSQDYILNSWAFVDLSSLGTLDKLTFGLTSSDNSYGSMNTPAYVALDNVGAVPEPSAWILFGLGLAIAGGLRSHRTSRRA